MSDALQFIQVGELARGISGATLPPDGGLLDTSLTLHCQDQTVTRLTFPAAGRLAWEVLEGPRAGAGGEESCLVTRPRDEVFVVDYVAGSQRATSVTIVLDRAQGAATTVVGTLPTEEEASRSAYALATEGAELTGVAVEFVTAFLDRPFVPGEHPHVPTDELVGKRVRYVYSQTEAYEHVYLNEDLYTWQCLEGSEKGLADTDRCHYRKIGDQLYLFVWREKIIPTLGVVLVDWRGRRSTGKLFGYESSDFGTLSNTPIASVATLLNVTRYV